MAAITLVLASAVVIGRETGLFGSGTRTKVAAPIPVVLPPTTTSTSTTTTIAAPVVPASTVLAAPNGTIPAFSAPGGPRAGMIGPWYGYSLTLPVVTEQPGWFEVRLPQRPNGSTAWVRSGDVAVSSTPYRIIVKLSTFELIVYRAGARILAFPIGIGVPATPTVTGNYFMTVRVPPPSPGYGPFVLSTSAHSEAIRSWEGAGDAIIAIHGPITSSADSRIGATGVRISNGCIRLHDSDLAQLSIIPAGTPIDILA
jgi:hypothetical protein